MLALDPGNITGFAYHDPQRKGELVSGVWRVNATEDFTHKTLTLRAKCKAELVGKGIQVAVVECIHDFFAYSKHSRGGKGLTHEAMAKNFATTIALASELVLMGMQVYYVDALTWKGKAGKEWSLQKAEAETGLKIKDHNQADAINLLDWFRREGHQRLKGV